MATYRYVEFCLDEAKNLADYTSIAFDLRTARDFAKTILDENQKPAPNVSLSDPFMVATIIRYTRAFGKNVRLNLDEEAASVLTPQQLLSHARFKDIRSKFIAHSVNAFEENEAKAHYCVERLEQEGITSIGYGHRRIIGLSDQNWTDIIDLASTWLRHVEQKLREETARLLPIVRQIPLDTLFKSAPEFTPGPDTSQPQKQRGTARRRRL
jgi:hypothetical protein